MDHVCIDIETLGTGDNPCLVQLAAVAFNLDTPFDRFAKINLHIDIADPDQGAIEGDTLKWWLSQDQKVRERVLTPKSPISLTKALTLFQYWIEGNTVQNDPETYGYDGAEFWACGVDFDFRILRQTYHRLKMTNPIPFSGTRDFRTMKRNVAPIRKVEVENRVFDESCFEMKHDALYDAMRDAQWLQRIIRSIPQKRK
jgi:hypothetical protein